MTLKTDETTTLTPLRMNAYYFAFTPTGVYAVDRILSAVARAGKGYHHTEGWNEPQEDWDGFSGGSYAGWIQQAASDAAREHATLTDQRAVLVEALQQWIGDGALQTFEDRERFRNAARAALQHAGVSK